MSGVALSHLRGLPEPGFAARRVLLRHKPKPGGKIAPAPEGGQVTGKCLDRKRRDRNHARHGLCSAHQVGFLGGTSHLRVKLCNTRIQPLNLPQIHPAEVTNLSMQRGVITCDCVRESLEMGRPAGRDQSVFGEVAA